MHSYFFIHLKRKFIKVEIKDICFVVSVAHHVKIVTDKEVLMPHLSLKQLEMELPPNLFTRVNKGTLIPINRVIWFDKETVALTNAAFSFSDKYRKIFQSRVTIVIHEESKGPA